MKTCNLILSLVIVFVLNSCLAYDISSDRDNNADFGKYKTFAWYAKDPQALKNDQFDNQIIESNIKNYVSAELKKRGMRVDLDNPDILFDYDLMVQKKVDQVQTPVYAHPYNYGYYNPYRPLLNPYVYPSTFVGYQTQDIPYKEGTLTISVVEKNSNKLVWRGWSVGTLTNGQTYESDLQSDIHAIFRQFPIKKVKINS